MDLPSQAINGVFATLVLLIMISGTAGNLLVVLVLRKQNICKRITGRQFLVSLALADIGGCINLIFMFATMLSDGNWMFGEGMCQLNGTLAILFGSASMWNLGAISLNRYVRIVRQRQYSAIFTKSMTSLMLASTWLVPLGMSVTPVFGWSAHRYQFDKFSCHFHFSEDISYTVMFICVIVLAPFTAILFSYVNIYNVTKQHRRANSSLRRNQPHIHIEEIRITGTLFVVIMTFIFCFIPGSVVNIVEMIRPKVPVPSWLDSITYILVVSNHANNPFIYGFLNRSLRIAFRKFLRQCCCCFGESEESIAVDSSFHRSKRSSLKTSRNSPSSPSSIHCHSYVTSASMHAELVSV